jgi:hypothetical protein
VTLYGRQVLIHQKLWFAYISITFLDRLRRRFAEEETA